MDFTKLPSSAILQRYRLIVDHALVRQQHGKELQQSKQWHHWMADSSPQVVQDWVLVARQSMKAERAEDILMAVHKISIAPHVDFENQLDITQQNVKMHTHAPAALGGQRGGLRFRCGWKGASAGRSAEAVVNGLGRKAISEACEVAERDNATWCISCGTPIVHDELIRCPACGCGLHYYCEHGCFNDAARLA